MKKNNPNEGESFTKTGVFAFVNVHGQQLTWLAKTQRCQFGIYEYELAEKEPNTLTFQRHVYGQAQLPYQTIRSE